MLKVIQHLLKSGRVNAANVPMPGRTEKAVSNHLTALRAKVKQLPEPSTSTPHAAPTSTRAAFTKPSKRKPAYDNDDGIDTGADDKDEGKASGPSFFTPTKLLVGSHANPCGH
jgi:hypothetical protein